MNLSLRHPLVSKAVPILYLFALWLSQILPLHAQATSWPTDWSCESLQDTSGEWWESLRIGTVPGVLYHLQESETLSAGTWTTLQSSYGTGTEWICPLFPGKAPSVAPPSDQSEPPVLPAATDPYCRNAFLTIENTTTGGTLLSWSSLDDGTPMRMVLPGVTLDPIWYEFDSSYLLAHGSYLYGLSPRLGTPLDFSETPPSLGPLDTAMVADFIIALPEITSNISNSVASAAASYGQLPEANGDRKFFRVAADWTMDCDGDGRYDWQEIVFDGNNPFAADSDGDGIPDVAQDNSGPAPTLDEETGPGVVATASLSSTTSPPRARIERNMIYGSRYVEYKPNDPTYTPQPSVFTEYSGEPASLLESATFAGFTTAVGGLPLLEENWEEWISPYSSLYNQSIPTSGSNDPKDDGAYAESFHVYRSAFRIRLDTPAPNGGYRFPLRVVSFARMHGLDGYPSNPDSPISNVQYEDLILEVAGGQTVGTAVFAATPAVGPNDRITSVPAFVTVNSYNIDDDPSFTYRDSIEGLCLLANEGIEARLEGYYSDTDQIKITWQKLRLSGDGSLGTPETLTPLMTRSELEAPEPPDDLDSRGFAYLRPDFPGIYQFQAVFNFPDGTKIPVPYLRMRHVKAIKNSNNEENALLKAGQPDYIGVCTEELSLNLRNEAIRWLERTEYAKASNVPVKPGSSFNPGMANRDKCNIFLTHLANRMGATTPYFFRKSKKSWITSLLSLIPSAPLARDDWHLNPELNIDLDLPGWRYMGEDPMPEPGMSAASYGNPPISGHCGILDYDGSWINAGKDNVNKSIHLSDASQHYKPTHLRKR